MNPVIQQHSAAIRELERAIAQEITRFHRLYPQLRVVELQGKREGVAVRGVRVEVEENKKLRDS